MYSKAARAVGGGEGFTSHICTTPQRKFVFVLSTYLHCVHLAGVGLPAAVDLPEAAPADDPVDGEVVHAQLDVQLQVLPLTEPGKLAPGGTSHTVRLCHFSEQTLGIIWDKKPYSTI